MRPEVHNHQCPGRLLPIVTETANKRPLHFFHESQNGPKCPKFYFTNSKTVHNQTPGHLTDENVNFFRT
jgi:hypothetical protein